METEGLNGIKEMSVDELESVNGGVYQLIGRLLTWAATVGYVADNFNRYATTMADSGYDYYDPTGRL